MELGQILKTPTCSLNFDLNFPEFPNLEVGDLKLRLLVTGVEARVEARVEAQVGVVGDTNCIHRLVISYLILSILLSLPPILCFTFAHDA
jgi:hypothetical protein